MWKRRALAVAKKAPPKRDEGASEGAKISIFARLAIDIIGMRLIVHVRSSHLRGQRAATRCQLPVTSTFFFLFIFSWVCNVLAPFLHLFSLWYEWPIRIRIMACRCLTTQGPIRCYVVFAWDAQILTQCFYLMWPTPQSANGRRCDAILFALRHDLRTIELNLYMSFSFLRSNECATSAATWIWFEFFFISSNFGVYKRSTDVTSITRIWKYRMGATKNEFMFTFECDTARPDRPTVWFGWITCKWHPKKWSSPDAPAATELVRWISI